MFGPYDFPYPYGSDQFDELMKKDIDYQHKISLLTTDGIEQDVNYYVHPPIDIISSRYEGVPYERTISKVRRGHMYVFI